jgi:predicted phosphodiesterase
MNILVIGDLHGNCMHPDAVKFLADIKRVHKPELVVQVGDLWDGYNFSRYLKDPDSPNAEQEIESTIEALQPLYKLFPEMKICYGNHDLRHLKKALDLSIPSSLFRSVKDILQAPEGWEFGDYWEYTDEEAGPILFHHGEMFGGPQLPSMLQTLRTNHVVGHIHSEGGHILYQNNGINTVWAANAGCLIDSESYAFRYAKKSRYKGVNGALLIIDGTPVFLPL